MVIRKRRHRHDYVLMPNHYHLVIETPEPTLSKAMHWLNTCYAIWFHRKYGRVGHLFQGRFKGILVETGEYFLESDRLALVSYRISRPGIVADHVRWQEVLRCARLCENVRKRHRAFSGAFAD